MKALTREALAVGAGSAVLYGLGAATTAQGGDASEFMAIAGAGGVAHPPGYPLFSLLVQAAAAVPVGTVAWRASMVAALQAAATLGVLYGLIRSLTGRRLPGLFAVGSLGLSLHFWRYATVSEVFAGAALTAALALAASLHLSRAPGPRSALLFGLALSTGIANHHTVVLLFPLGLFCLGALLRGPRPARSIAAGAAGLVPGFALYGTLMLPGGAWRWGQTASGSGLVHHFLRRDYGTTRLAVSDADVSALEHPLHWLSTLPAEFFGVGAVLALLGLVVGWRGHAQRAWVGAAAASLLFAGPLFLSLFNVPAEGDWLVVTSRFHILPNTLLALFIGLGTAWLLERLPPSGLVPAALLASLALPLALNAQRAPHRGWTVLEDYLLNSLAAAEPDALVLGSGDPTLFGIVYVQDVLGVRPDVAVVNPRMLGYPWYRDWVRQRWPQVVIERDGVGLFGANLVWANVEDRPVYLRLSLAAEPAFRTRMPPMWPVGAVLMRAVPPSTPVPHPAAVEAELRRALDGLLLRSRVETRFQARQTWEYKDYDQYALAFDTLASAWELEGDAAAVARCRETAAELSPWRFGERD